MKVLLLNSSFQALCYISWQRAASLIVAQKAVPLGDVVKTVQAPKTTIDVHELLMLTDCGYINIPHYSDDARDAATVSFQRIRERDFYTCAYCGKHGDTVDHIIPRSKGGKNTWDNLITCCGACNRRKADRTPIEAGMKLLYEPEPVVSKWEVLQRRLNKKLAALTQ